MSWVFLKISMTISIQSSRRDLFIVVVDRFMFKDNPIMLFPGFDLPKPGTLTHYLPAMAFGNRKKIF